MTSNVPTLENPTYDNLKSADESHQMHGFGHPYMQKAPKSLIVFESGSGCKLKDVNGNEYIDCLAGITVSNLGHGREEIAKVAYEQMCRLEVGSNQRNMTTQPAVQLCERLAELSKRCFGQPFDGARVYLTVGGAEGIEAAYHLALRYWNKSGLLGSSSPGYWKKKKIISLRNCYHGSTFIPASLKPEFSDYGWHRLTEGWENSKKEDNTLKFFNTIDAPHELFFNKNNIKEGENIGQAAARMLEERIQEMNPDEVAAFIFEPVQGDGGAVSFHPDFFPLARQVCDKYKVLMIADEIMAFAKTGKWFGMENYGVAPDIMVISKGISSGYLPMGAVIYRDNIWKTAMNSMSTKMMVSDIWQHDYTWSGHPTCCAVALKVMDILERDNLIDQAAIRGKRFLEILKDKLQGLKLVKDVRGSGVMLGIDLTSDIASDCEMRMLLEKKIVLRASSNKHCLLMTPPIIMTDEEFTQAAEALKDILNSWGAFGSAAMAKPRQW